MMQLALGPLMIDIAGTLLTDLDRERLCHPLVGGIVQRQSRQGSIEPTSQPRGTNPRGQGPRFSDLPERVVRRN